jgi:hypothetical protein
MQFQTTTIHFDPNYTFDWDDYSNLKDWPGFHITYADDRRLVFNLKEGVAYEQLEVGGPFYPLMVHQHEYKPPPSRPKTSAASKTKTAIPSSTRPS